MAKLLMKSDEMSSHRCYEAVRMIKQRRRRRRRSWKRLKKFDFD